ncbi:hypothetical protein SEA_SONALI_37 [Arthrobacter phage Sonali]|uniref:Uncharacterized protein n=1 Tax=Arthrobacter phage Sonali TaxID=2510495 RepID=A0A411CQE0_9CAUD|nr:hypothetical protein HOV09_gp37 [Arthrobacter phage Sonali]QAY16149.1 hypothetical protein SEA_SONALI_37 [Arthrobacter phage Sonali]
MTNAAAALRNVAKTTDALLVEAWWAVAKAGDRVRDYAGIKANCEKRGTTFHYADALAKAEEALEAAQAKAAPLEAIANAGDWSRFVLVPNGHLHRGFGCSTLRWTTQTGLMPEFSGADEAEVVELAGEVACTVCFPSAPVNRPSMLPVHVKEREEAAKAKAEKEATKTKADAEKVTVGRQVYKTLRAAENAISWEMENVVSRTWMNAQDEAHRAHLDNLVAEDRGAVEAIADAIQAVYPEWDRQGVLAKKFDAKVKVYRKAGFDIPAGATY